MASARRQVQQLARQLFKLSLVDGEVSADRVAGVLEYVEKNRPAHPVAVLRAYQGLVAAEVARGQAVVEHAGPLAAGVLEAITASMARRYGRRISGTTRRNDALLAGVRVRVGDDVFESSVSGQLEQLARSV
jgi:F-type H+-transporting ATPase subunit delta